jgi:Holliday junction resolvase
MSGRRSRDKGNRTERAIVRLLQAQGIAATKISGMYKPGADISMPLLGSDRAVEVKCRAAGFAQLGDMDGGTQAVTAVAVKADRREPFVIVCTFMDAKIDKPALGPVGDSLDDWGAT